MTVQKSCRWITIPGLTPYSIFNSSMRSLPKMSIQSEQKNTCYVRDHTHSPFCITSMNKVCLPKYIIAGFLICHYRTCHRFRSIPYLPICNVRILGRSCLCRLRVTPTLYVGRRQGYVVTQSSMVEQAGRNFHSRRDPVDWFCLSKPIPLGELQLPRVPLLVHDSICSPGLPGISSLLVSSRRAFSSKIYTCCNSSRVSETCHDQQGRPYVPLVFRPIVSLSHPCDRE